MQKFPLFFRFLAIGGLILLLLIPLSIIRGVISERQSYRKEVVEDLAKSWAGTQKIIGAILVVPYQQKITKKEKVYKYRKQHTVFKEEVVQKYKYVLPEHLVVNGDIVTQERYRGIYKVPVYVANLQLKGHFTTSELKGVSEDPSHITWQKPYIVLGVEDLKGIKRYTTLRVNDKQVSFSPGTRTPSISEGIHATLAPQYLEEEEISFVVELELSGMEELSFLPVGKRNEVTLSSSWPHPSFFGGFLPEKREVNEDGFHAYWKISSFVNNVLQECEHDGMCLDLKSDSFGVALYQAVDVYLQAERARKYALLFIVLTFTFFFLFEVLKNWFIHPVQYALVGSALALFYLLLVSLSEHISFVFSYVIATSACVMLLSFYVRFVLGSLRQGILFAVSLTMLYGILYVFISSEEYVLLMASAFLFAVLGFIMFITRHVDWHKVGNLANQQKQIDE